MKINDIIINTSNHHLYDAEDGWRYRDCLEANMSLNKYLDVMLDPVDGSKDWGGEYYSWLSSFKIPANSENGWWSEQAVHQDNIKLFIIHTISSAINPSVILDNIQEQVKMVENTNIRGFKVGVECYKETVAQILVDNDYDLPEQLWGYDDWWEEMVTSSLETER